MTRPDFKPGDRVEVGLAYKMALHAPYAGQHSLEPDEYTDARGFVVAVCTDGSLEVECDDGRGVFVHADRVRKVVGTVAQPSFDEELWPDAIIRGRIRRGLG